MDLQPRGYQKIVRLLERGVSIPNPLSMDIGDDVNVDLISSDGVTLWPGCRIRGAKTVISAGCTLGAEGPVTLLDCRLGPKVALKGGFFKQSVFLEKASIGLGAQVREGCLLEEEATCAHTVGLKQTILFPFVALGSLINFCDCLMAGGTSREDHSEVGSSYIHFNYTPNGDKTTPSLFGDVSRGVLLNESAIFLGGHGGTVGPIRVGYGTVVAAGSILLKDILEDGKLVAAAPPPGFERDRRPHTYKDLVRVIRNNVIYLANLVALETWYREVRRPFFTRQELGTLVYEGALEVLALAKDERIRRLMAMAAKTPAATSAGREFSEHAAEVCALFEGNPAVADGAAFLAALQSSEAAAAGTYVETIQSLAPEVRAVGTVWLQTIVDAYCERADALSGLALFDKRSSMLS